METEIWKTVTECPQYECSNFGNFRRLSSGKNTKTGMPTKVFVNKVTGYCSVTFSQVEPRTYAAHKVIARTWLPNPFNYKIVMFKDGNKQNLRPDNLYWANRYEVRTSKKIWAKHIKTGEMLEFESKTKTCQHFDISPYKLRKYIREGISYERWKFSDNLDTLHTLK